MSKGLQNLHAPLGANRKRKRVGRGESSGSGKTSGRGNKGQGARTGKGKPGLGFEGGQMPMYRRLPKRGFENKFRKMAVEINLERFADKFPSDAVVDRKTLLEVGISVKDGVVIRVLGRGEVAKPLTVYADHFTASARNKIEAAGGRAIEPTN